MIYCPTCMTPLSLTWKGETGRSECSCCHALWNVDVRCLRPSTLAPEVLEERRNQWK